jgi:hypothetical protein
VQLRGARLMLQHAGGLELVLALADAYSRYVFAPYVSPNPPVRAARVRAEAGVASAPWGLQGTAVDAGARGPPRPCAA